MSDIPPEKTAYRNALLWAFDRLSTSGLTAAEIRRTADGIGKVLTGKPTPAATYTPNDWDDSAVLTRVHSDE